MTIKIAIIGSGPSAFYTAQSLIKEEIECEIDIIEKLFCPYGLIRYGVAPDHQSTKNVIRVFERTLSNPYVEFFGGIEIKLIQAFCSILVLFANSSQIHNRVSMTTAHRSLALLLRECMSASRRACS